MSKLSYIGVPTAVPEYEEVLINITADNYDEYLGCGARDDNSSFGFYFFWDNNRIINTACGQRENADMSFDALCDIEKLSFRMTGCAGLL